MRIANFNVNKSKDGSVWSDYTGKWEKILNDDIASKLLQLRKIWKNKKYAMSIKESVLESTLEFIRTYDETAANEQIEEAKPEITIEEQINTIKHVMNDLIKFFSEFSFEPNFRFVNTLVNYATCCDDEIACALKAKNYIRNYFKLVDHQYASSISEKILSAEFTDLIIDAHKLPVTKIINKRFKVYYGSQGTGKTTDAMNEANGLCMVCHSAMLPSDLMEDFKFEDGQPSFKPSALQIAMTTGQTMVLDEINLLPFESLRFLQSILDGKTEFTYKGNVINIVDGFQVIGTMNLTVNGNTFSLPEPLVDRASELREYRLTAESLVGALL